MGDGIGSHGPKAIIALVALVVVVSCSLIPLPVRADAFSALCTQLTDAGAGVHTVSAVISRHTRNIGTGNRLLESGDAAETVIVDLGAKKMKHVANGHACLYKFPEHKVVYDVNGELRELDHDRPLQQTVPYPLLFALFPDYLLGQVEHATVEVQGSHATVVGIPMGSVGVTGATLRREIEIDLVRASILHATLYDAKGRLVEDVTAEGWQRAGGRWFPRVIRVRRFGTYNTVEMTFVLGNLEVNTTSTAALTLP